MTDANTIVQDDFFERWKESEERYIKELNWINEAKKLCGQDTLKLRRLLPAGSSKTDHYTNIVKEAWQRAQSIGATYLIAASNWLPIFLFAEDFESIKGIGAIQGSYTAGTYKGLPVVISPTMDSFEMLCGADTPTPEYNIENIDASKFIFLRLED
jgi:hypothetical protein